jgi:galactose-1-phosphate uridylyltransferase
MAVEKWKSYLQHLPFVIYTDHKSLIHLEEQQLTNNIQHKAFCKLLGLQYQVKYKQGTANAAADVL